HLARLGLGERERAVHGERAARHLRIAHRPACERRGLDRAGRVDDEADLHAATKAGLLLEPLFVAGAEAREVRVNDAAHVFGRGLAERLAPALRDADGRRFAREAILAGTSAEPWSDPGATVASDATVAVAEVPDATQADAVVQPAAARPGAVHAEAA